MKVNVIWNVDHDQAAIEFVGSYIPKEPPSEAVNHVLDVMYNVNREEGKALQLYMYEVWGDDDETLIGLLFAESMEIEDDVSFDSVIRSIYRKILESDKTVQQDGAYERKTFSA